MKFTYRVVVTALLAALALPIAAQAAKGERKKKDVPPAFATVDKNGDDAVSESEYVAANEKIGAEAAKSQFGKLDKNQDGKLTKEEFGTVAKEKKKPRKKKNQG